MPCHIILKLKKNIKNIVGGFKKSRKPKGLSQDLWVVYTISRFSYYTAKNCWLSGFNKTRKAGIILF